jgi:RHS repeat-associated protein
VPAASNFGRFQYTGQYWLAEPSLYYYKARFYDPKLGLFLQTDPKGYDAGENLYAYVGDDPVNKADPDGLQLVEKNPNDHELVTRVNAVVSSTQAQTVRLDPDTTMTMQRAGSNVAVSISHTEQLKGPLGIKFTLKTTFSGHGTIMARPGQVSVTNIALRSESSGVAVKSAPNSLTLRNERNGAVGVHTDRPLTVELVHVKTFSIPKVDKYANPPAPSPKP